MNISPTQSKVQIVLFSHQMTTQFITGTIQMHIIWLDIFWNGHYINGFARLPFREKVCKDMIITTCISNTRSHKSLMTNGGGGKGYSRATFLPLSYFPFTVLIANYFPFTVLGAFPVHRSQ